MFFIESKLFVCLTGSTWLKAVCASIMQGNNEEEEDLLVKDNPHFYVPTIEAMDYYLKTPTHDLYNMPSIYITRNPKDTLISMRHFFNYNRKRLEDLSPLEDVVEYSCNGVHQYGPFFEHVLEYWEASKRNPQKILFLKYEDLKIDPKKSEEDLEIVLNKCSLERLKNLEINKSGSIFSSVHNNHMTLEMEEQLDKITKLKLQASGLELC
uniref:Sulfotransferase n=1 Tax=Solanum lycopersicum TaxID=4081 RepID=A0A3Q7GG18_SOLLC